MKKVDKEPTLPDIWNGAAIAAWVTWFLGLLAYGVGFGHWWRNRPGSIRPQGIHRR